MKIAIVDDYLKMGGAIQVVTALHEIFPEAPIYTIFSEVEKDSLLKEKLGKAKIIESWFAKIPYHQKLISPLRFLIPFMWSSFDFSQYDLVISSASWAITKGFANEKTKEICYCHTPPRYLYGYETSRNWKKHWYVRVYAAIVNHFMRQYDFKRAQKVTWFIANSREVQNRIKKFYRRDSTIIHPPVETKKFLAVQKTRKGKYFLTGGRLEAAKNFDLIVKAFSKLKLPLVVFGSGVQEEYLKSIASANIEFVGNISEEKKREFLLECKAFVVAAGDEDFGITPVEAMAAGRPVIAFKGGGYLETVIDGETGIFFDDLSPTGLAKVLHSFDDKKFKPEDCQTRARNFSKEQFKLRIQQFIKDCKKTSDAY